MQPVYRLVASWAFAGLLLSVAACATPKLAQIPDDLVKDDSGKLLSTEQLSASPFSVVQRVSGKQGRQNVAFECVVRLAERKLTVAGTTLHSPNAFAIEQRGIDVHAQSSVVRELPFEAVNVLYDIHRVFFRGLGPRADGLHEGVDDDEVVRELWRDGRLVERAFHSLDTFAKLVVIGFEGAPAPIIAPRVHLTNLRYGYALDIENLHQQRSDGAYSLDVEKNGTADVR